MGVPREVVDALLLAPIHASRRAAGPWREEEPLDANQRAYVIMREDGGTDDTALQGVLREITARRKGSDTIESFGIVNHSILEFAR